jgi:hypothetical protein
LAAGFIGEPSAFTAGRPSTVLTLNGVPSADTRSKVPVMRSGASASMKFGVARTA